ncbi:cytochrome b561 and DOMON domain-containing protein At5g47530-like [Punica granatum]|uniref:Cytochrome b561 and DOMON domain-containing protein n=2 Tax=Punica granatum TaxID=22663 RepID=A0A2I0K918_PUNGR|nr:cytochrome b561 and DOMON domain-containing protein At5g47530-like [Punica granatum]PKI64216.1 hypothetical protein CRG98_015403 [Punica granatum]
MNMNMNMNSSKDMMMRPFRVLFFSIALLSAFFVPTALSQACRGYTFSNSVAYETCTDLPVLSSSLHWTYDQSTSLATIAFRRSGASSSQWISWGINRQGAVMLGTQALMAHQNSSTGSIVAYTTPIDSMSPSLAPGSLSFGVPTISATLDGDVMTIFATLQLTSDMVTVNQVWQYGEMNGASPGVHPTSGANLQSVGTVNLLSGAATGGSNSRQRRRNVHGVLNAVSWGTLMPLGALIARYLKVFKSADPAWFYLHITCQTSAYIVGVAGWATGMKLRSDSSGSNDVHGNIGITLFAMGTLQVFALLLRPKPDHKYRLYWNIYHHAIGYAVISLSIVNVFEGLDILDPAGKWRTAYIIVIALIGGCAVLLEGITWAIVLKRRRTESHDQKFSHGFNGTNAYGNGGAHDGV